MKRLMLAFALIIGGFAAQAQYIGTNGANSTDVMTQEVIDYMVSGASEVAPFIFRYRPDKFIGYPPDLDSIVTLHEAFEAAGKSIWIIYTAEMLVTEQIYNYDAIKYLIDHGVTILNIELGNETYSKKQCNFVWECLRPAVEELQDLLNADVDLRFIPLSYPIAPNPELSDVVNPKNVHETWNNSFFAWRALNADPEDQNYVHLYFNGTNIPVMANLSLPEPVAYNPLLEYVGLDTFFSQLYSQAQDDYDEWQEMITYINEKSPGKKLNITEFGISNSSAYKNTMAYSALLWDLMLLYSDDVYNMLIHNGPSPTGAGIINPYNTKYDINFDGGAYLPRLDWFTITLFNDLPAGWKPLTSSPQLEVGDNYFTVTNMNTSYTQFFEGATEVQYTYLSGAKPYSGAGKTDFWATGTVPNAEITGVRSFEVTGNVLFIPQNSFGFIRVTVPEPDILGCMDPTATNYNAYATVDDGSCLYPPPPPPVECRKKTWFFCFKSKRNCNC